MRYFLLITLPFLFCSCGVFDSGQVELAMQVIEQMEIKDTITAQQAEALRQALATNTGEPWYYQLGRVAIEVALAVAGVRIWRGPAAGAAERVARAAMKNRVTPA